MAWWRFPWARRRGDVVASDLKVSMSNDDLYLQWRDRDGVRHRYDGPALPMAEVLDLLLVVTRELGDDGTRVGFDATLAEFGLTRADLDDS